MWTLFFRKPAHFFAKRAGFLTKWSNFFITWARFVTIWAQVVRLWDRFVRLWAQVARLWDRFVRLWAQVVRFRARFVRISDRLIRDVLFVFLRVFRGYLFCNHELRREQPIKLSLIKTSIHSPGGYDRGCYGSLQCLRKSRLKAGLRTKNSNVDHLPRLTGNDLPSARLKLPVLKNSSSKTN